MSPPIIDQPLKDKKVTIGSKEKLNCASSGYPKPTVTFYRNSEPIQFDYLVSLEEQVLTIHSYEEDQKGKHHKHILHVHYRFTHMIHIICQQVITNASLKMRPARQYQVL